MVTAKKSRTKVLKSFFSNVTDDELIDALKQSLQLKPLTDYFDGALLAPKMAEEELERRHNDHLSLFFGL